MLGSLIRRMVSPAHGKHIAYGSASLFINLLHNIFLLYHVEIFVSYYRIDRESFWWGEAIFLVWNSLNDFICGWVSDQNLLGSGTQVRVSQSTALRRIEALAFGGPGFAIAFSLVWYNWAPPNLQFVVCLCLYDGFLTYLDLNHSALLADLATTEVDRTNLSLYSSLASAFGCISVFFSFAVWDKNNVSMFRIYCACIAVISAIGFQFSTILLRCAEDYSAQPAQLTIGFVGSILLVISVPSWNHCKTRTLHRELPYLSSLLFGRCFKVTIFECFQSSIWFRSALLTADRAL